uniref:PAP-associated domain-containing protein n=1 Tax=Globodera pallida TaxID=36090 RepID=A0A183CLA2_GLOPA
AAVRHGTLLINREMEKLQKCCVKLEDNGLKVLTLSVAFPVPRGFLSDPDSIIAEDLELFTGFSQSNVLILRKGCSADYRSYVFQYAILRHAVNAAPFNDTDLRLIHPPMFKRFFLHQEGLTIARVVQVELPVQKYNPPLSPWLKAYCVGHFLLLLCIFLHFEYDRGQLGYVDFSLKIAFFVCTMQSFGAFFDKKKFAPFLEIFRSIGVIAYYATRTIIERRGLQPNRIFMAALFAVSAIAFAVIPLRDLARKASKVTPKRGEPIGTVRKEFENGENGIAEVTDKTTETKRNGVDMDRTKRNGVGMDRTKRNGVDMDRTKRNGVDMDRTKRNDGVDMDKSGCWI